MVVSVEEVDLVARSLYVRVKLEVFEQSASSSLLHADDESPRQSFGGKGAQTVPCIAGGLQLGRGRTPYRDVSTNRCVNSKQRSQVRDLI